MTSSPSTQLANLGPLPETLSASSAAWIFTLAVGVGFVVVTLWCVIYAMRRKDPLPLVMLGGGLLSVGLAPRLRTVLGWDGIRRLPIRPTRHKPLAGVSHRAADGCLRRVSRCSDPESRHLLRFFAVQAARVPAVVGLRQRSRRPVGVWLLLTLENRLVGWRRIAMAFGVVACAASQIRLHRSGPNDESKPAPKQTDEVSTLQFGPHRSNTRLTGTGTPT